MQDEYVLERYKPVEICPLLSSTNRRWSIDTSMFKWCSLNPRSSLGTSVSQWSHFGNSICAKRSSHLYGGRRGCVFRMGELYTVHLSLRVLYPLHLFITHSEILSNGRGVGADLGQGFRVPNVFFWPRPPCPNLQRNGMAGGAKRL